MTLASAGLEVTAVELDETTAAVATVNLTPFPETRVVQADVQSLDLDGLPGGRPEALWLDRAADQLATAAESAIAARSTRQVYHHLLLGLARLASQAPAQSLGLPVRHGAPALDIHEHATSINVHALSTRIGRPHISLTIK